MRNPSDNNGIGVNCGHFTIDEATWNAIKSDTNAAMGLGVTLTGNNTVGFGVAAGSPLYGILQVIETRETASVAYTGIIADVPVVAATKPAVGETGLGVNNKGQIIKIADGKRGTALSVDATVTVQLPL